MGQISEEEKETKTNSLEFLHDVTLEVAVEFGRIQATIRDILKWKPGSILVLSKDQGEPLDILANGNKVAAGEAVIVNENFGVRVTQVVDPQELQIAGAAAKKQSY